MMGSLPRDLKPVTACARVTDRHNHDPDCMASRTVGPVCQGICSVAWDLMLHGFLEDLFPLDL